VEHRPLGRTGFEVSEIGYGAWGIGGSQWGGADDDESIEALNRAIDLGVDFIATALAYGDGRSERVVGQVVRERSERIHVATKVPPRNGQWPAQPGVPVDEVFPGDYVRECAERSLRNLALDRIDVLQFHVWNDDWTEAGDWRETVDELRSSGLFGAFGVSINDHHPANSLRLIESGAVDTVQVIYNVFDQSPEDELFPACRERGIGVIARVPLDEGALAGAVGPDTEFPDGDFRAHYFRGDRRREVDQHVEAILDDLAIARDELAETALRFVLSEPAVSTVIPGMRSARNAERNAAVSHLVERAGTAQLHAAVLERAHADARAAPLVDLELPAKPAAELHGGGAGRLVLRDAVPDREHAGARGAAHLVDPGPGPAVVVPAGRSVERLHLGHRPELHPLERRRPLGARRDERRVPVVADVQLAGGHAQGVDGRPL
jgi:aryl-alcohol dehydrogenase-like predicted oxidoreductase